MTHDTPFNNPNWRGDEDPLQSALDNPTYNEIIRGSSPIALEEILGMELERRDSVMDIASKIGWPDPRPGLPDSELTGLGLPLSDIEFMERLTPGEYYDPKIDLTQLINFLTVPVADLTVEAGKVKRTSTPLSTAEVEYGSQPFYIRANAVAPGLIQVLKEEVRFASLEQPRVSQGEAALNLVLADQKVRRGLHMLYRIMGRLIKTTDRTTHFELEGYSGHIGRPIVDVNEVLGHYG